MFRRSSRSVAAHLATGSILLLAAAAPVGAQTGYFPYFGKNRVKYDNFKWHIYTTDHFEIYYYPETEPHLERVAGYAESAYQKISADLKHDLAAKVPIVLFKTHSEFEQQNVIPGDVPEGVAAFAEPQRDRMVLPIDEPPDQLYRLIVHELTHIFEFDIIPRSLIRRGIPLWMDEGLADHEAEVWRPLDLMTIRDAAVADIVPRMSKMEGYGQFSNPRLIYNLGHAAFEFIESRWGKEGIRQFLFALRKNVIGGGEDAYEEAFQLTPEEFDEQFDKYLKDRFKPFRDKERPADYGRNLAPDPEKTRYNSVLTIEPSPSGDLIAAMTANRKDQELDIVLLSTKDGQVVRNLTSGFDQDRGYQFISIPGARFNTVPWMAWTPAGDRIASFARVNKSKALILQTVLNGEIDQRFELRMVDEPESPSMSPDGRRAAFSALRNGVGDIYLIDLSTGQVENVTNDDFADYAPTFSPDGKFLIYVARISGYEKLFRLDLDAKKKTQITFGTHHDSAAKFIDARTLVFSSTAVDPVKPLPPEVDRNAVIYNVWTLDLENGALRQYTDTLGGNVSPVAIKDGETTKIAFVTYYKGQYGLHTLERKEPLSQASVSDFGAPGPIIDFQAPMAHTLITSNKKKKGTFEKLFLEGRPPVAVGVTSGGNVFGGTEIIFSDVLGDQQFNVFLASISQYRTLSFSWVNLAKRFQFAVQGYSQTQFFYGTNDYLYDPIYSSFIDRDLAQATRTMRGGSVFGIYPLSRFRRVELFGGVVQFEENYNNPDLEQIAEDYQEEQYGTQIFRNGVSVPLGVAFVQETTIFREFGPLAGNTVRVGYQISPDIGDTLSRQTVDLDARYYLRLGSTGVLALRGRGFKSWGEAPDFFYYGGNSEMRGYEYLEFLGHRGFFANAELRFPLIEAMLTPIGILGGVRGVFFANLGATGFVGESLDVFTNNDEIHRPLVGVAFNPITGLPENVYGPPRVISGLRLKDGRASYGVGLETFALGFPIHIDVSWRTLLNRDWEDIVYSLEGGSERFRRPQVGFWIGYDF
jgi:hypothetical protein